MGLTKKLLAAGMIASVAAGIIIGGGEDDKPVEKLTVVQELILRKVGEEIVSMRTESSETFKGDDGGLRSKVYASPKYFKDKETGDIKDFDLKVNEVSVLAKLNPLRKHDKYIEIGNNAATWFDNKSYDYKFITADGQYVKYTALFDTVGITIETIPQKTGVKQNYILRKSGTPTELKWLIDTNLTIDAGNGNCDVLFRSVIDNNIPFRIPIPVAWDAQNNDIPVEVNVFNGVLTYSLNTTKTWTYPITVDPTTTTITASNNGLVQNTAKSTYVLARDPDDGVLATDRCDVGQNYNATPYYYVYRSFASFTIPACVFVSACSLYVNGAADGSTTDFEIYIHSATEYKSVLDAADFSHFDGRQTGAAHNGTVLNETWNSSSYSADWNILELNAAGRNSVCAAQDDTLWIALISKEDFDNSAPAGPEYISFDSSEDAGTEPYLSITYSGYNEIITSDFVPQLIKTHKPNAANRNTYSNARGVGAYAAVVTTAIDTLGQAAIADTCVYRISMRIPIPNKMNEVYACSLFVTGAADVSTTDFNIEGRMGEWTADANEGTRHYLFDGHASGLTAYTGTNIFETFSTANFNASGADTLIFNAAGLLKVEDASEDTLRILMLSSRDVSASYPAQAEYVVFNTSNPILRIRWALNDSIPNELAMTAIAKDSITVSWNDRCLDETGYRIVNVADTTLVAGTDTTAVNVETLRVGGLLTNTVYEWMVQVVGGVYADSLSAADSCYTLAVAPQNAPVLSFADNDTLVFASARAGSLGTGNPSYTEYAFQDSITGYYIDNTAHPDTLDTVDIHWATIATWGESVRVDISAYIGKTFLIRSKARSGQ